MNFSKKARLTYLAVAFLVLGAIYWGFGATPLTLPITISYYVLCLILSVAYVLINGGITPMESSGEAEKSGEEQQRHPVKKKDRYRRFSQEEGKLKGASLPEPRPNPLRLSEEKRIFLSQSVLIVLIPLYVIFILDWILLKFLV